MNLPVYILSDVKERFGEHAAVVVVAARDVYLRKTAQARLP